MYLFIYNFWIKDTVFNEGNYDNHEIYKNINQYL